jgi:hypothetical protein
MPKTLVSLPQITPPPNINSNAALLTDISRFAALNPKERLALQVWLRAKELANDGSSPLSNYDPATASKVMALIQDANTVFGHIPVGDLEIASLAIDWANCKAVFASLSTDVDTLRNSSNMGLLSEMTNEDLRRALLYLRMEIGE